MNPNHQRMENAEAVFPWNNVWEMQLEREINFTSPFSQHAAEQFRTDLTCKKHFCPYEMDCKWILCPKIITRTVTGRRKRISAKKIVMFTKRSKIDSLHTPPGCVCQWKWKDCLAVLDALFLFYRDRKSGKMPLNLFRNSLNLIHATTYFLGSSSTNVALSNVLRRSCCAFEKLIKKFYFVPNLLFSSF